MRSNPSEDRTNSCEETELLDEIVYCKSAVGAQQTSVNLTKNPAYYNLPGNENFNDESALSKVHLKNSLKNDKQMCRSSLLEEALIDCYGRFLSPLPEYHLKDQIHLYFQIQEAFWWYDDIWRDSYPTLLPKFTLRDFGFLICNDCELLKFYLAPERHDEFMQTWRDYCRTIPLRGAILLDENVERCLLVRDWNGNRWMFPRGKTDEAETDDSCACREIEEEIGVSLRDAINLDMFIQGTLHEQPVKLFIVPGIKSKTHFYPKRRKEISGIMWTQLQNLPGWIDVENQLSKNKKKPSRQAPLKTWQVAPFVESLFKWVQWFRVGKREKTSKESILAYQYELPCFSDKTIIEDARSLNTNLVEKYYYSSPMKKKKKGLENENVSFVYENFKNEKCTSNCMIDKTSQDVLFISEKKEIQEKKEIDHLHLNNENSSGSKLPAQQPSIIDISNNPILSRLFCKPKEAENDFGSCKLKNIEIKEIQNFTAEAKTEHLRRLLRIGCGDEETNSYEQTPNHLK